MRTNNKHLTKRCCRTNFPLRSKFAAERGVMPQFKEVRETMRYLSIVFILFLSACAQSLTDDTRPTEQSSNSSSSFTYQCKSGKTIKASYPTDSTAVVEYDNRVLEMKIAVSGSGARYVGEKLEWWTKGSGQRASGTLFRHLEDGTSGEAVEQCAQVADAA